MFRRITKRLQSAVVALATFVAVVTASSAASAAIINLTTSSGQIADDGFCALPEAIVAANTNAKYYGCPKGSGDDIIQIPIGGYVDLTYAAAMQITSPIEITTFGSSDNKATIYGGSGASNFRVRLGGKLKLTRVKLTTFNYITAISMEDGTSSANRAEVTVTRCEIYNNYTDAVAQTSVLSVGTAGYAQILNSYIHDNTSIKGGAMRIIGGTVYINRSVISNNVAHQYGGAIQVFKYGAYAPYLNIVTSTIINNRADLDGGAIWTDSDTYAGIMYSTITGNSAGGLGGAINFSGTNSAELTLYRNIIADNPATNSVDTCKGINGAFYSSGENVFRGCGGTWTRASDVTLTNQTLGLQPLAAAATNWVWPPEMVPLWNSPVKIFSGAQCTVSSEASTDQNYTLRSADNVCAAGASEP